MAASPVSPASSLGNSRYGSALDHGLADSIPVETLVDHLLAAKRALSSMTLVLRANDLSTHARQLHEEAVISAAQTAFLQRGIRDQVKLLMRVRRSLIRTYDAGKRDFKQIPKTLDAANAKLEATMDMLRSTTVEPVFRPPGEDPKNLLDFVDESKVEKLRDALKASIGELQVRLLAVGPFNWPVPRRRKKLLIPVPFSRPPKLPSTATFSDSKTTFASSRRPCPYPTPLPRRPSRRPRPQTSPPPKPTCPTSSTP